MDVTLITGCALVGALSGDLLDVAGARLATASLAAEDLQRAEDARLAEDDGPIETADRPASSEPAEATYSSGVVPVFETPLHRCPSCGTARRGMGVVPAIGAVAAVVTRRPCRTCGAAPPLRPVAAVVLTAVLCAAAAVRFGDSAAVVPYAVLFAFLVAMTTTDVTTQLLPKRLVYVALVLVSLLLAVVSIDHRLWTSLEDAAIGGAAAFAAFFALWWFVPKGIGFGDVRLSGLLGMALGWLGLAHVYVGLLAGFAAGAVVGVMLMAVAGFGRKSKIPFGPFLAFGAVVSVLWGSDIISWWPHPGA